HSCVSMAGGVSQVDLPIARLAPWKAAFPPEPVTPRPPRPQAPARAPQSFVVRRGDELRVFLGTPLEGEEIVIAAAAAREASAQRRPRRIDRAAALVGIEETAHAAEDMVFLPAHGILGTPALHRELRPSLAKREPEMFGQPLHVALGESDQGIGAAVARTLLAVVHGL